MKARTSLSPTQSSPQVVRMRVDSPGKSDGKDEANPKNSGLIADDALPPQQFPSPQRIPPPQFNPLDHMEGVPSPRGHMPPPPPIPNGVTRDSRSTSSSHQSHRDTRRDISPRTGLLSPIPNGVRRVSGGGGATPMRPTFNSDGYMAGPTPTFPPSTPSYPPSPGMQSQQPQQPRDYGFVPSHSHTPSSVYSQAAGDDVMSPPVSQWSAAVGHATTSGKSGRIIDKLMGESDKMKRELNETHLKIQQLQEELAVQKPRMEELERRNDHLTHASEVDKSLLDRKDRKIEELKADNATMKERMLKAEAAAQQCARRLEEDEAKHARDTQRMIEESKHATINAKILQESYRRLQQDIEQRRDTWTRDIREVQQQLDTTRTALNKGDIVREHMRLEIEKQKKLYEQMVAKWEVMEREMHEALHKGENSDEVLRKKSMEMEELTKQMRYVVGVKKARPRDASPSGASAGSRGVSPHGSGG
ncbi:hypothetical protein EJ03DRAFT_124689 [Teratosphaeria nubilosa]|uniref:SWI5-dependent HO expression protein 3 n=1 Tax=Teratosphaeria nubilosa TaxID=161662 RepID=A0A6G1LK55_9PEZI|nr:hypothetical protein EJ03DRAFT_124689 [Teratosphaeria nubilosa]